MTLDGHTLWLINQVYLQLAGEVLDAGTNHILSAYPNNLAAEGRKYKYDVDREMTTLKFVDDDWGPVGKV